MKRFASPVRLSGLGVKKNYNNLYKSKNAPRNGEAFCINFIYCLILFKSRNTCNIRTGNQQMNVVRSFIGNHTFQIHTVAHD